ncbi:MAG: hypothetical protein V4564_17050 [Pseudomonadota bacterium]|uniref:hypothetical protein n=1 Tax=Sphingomonas sp. ERG5 TaxID=1381597 RepID=UPI000B2F10A2|nr:hypothetical protein [Sphingomonas sp. ERG5]
MKSIDSKSLKNQFEALDKAIVNTGAKTVSTIARKTPYEPFDVFTSGGRGAG